MNAAPSSSTCRYEWMYAQPYINRSQTAADDLDSLHFRLDPNGHQAVRHTPLSTATDECLLLVGKSTMASECMDVI